VGAAPNEEPRSIGSPRSLRFVAAAAAAIALIQLARLAIFTVDPTRTECSLAPTSRWEVAHSCATAYFVAAQASASTANFYDNALYSSPDDDPELPRKPRLLGPFNVDVYEYPPQFLLLPRAFELVTPDFPRFRMLWFAMSGAVLLLGLWTVARFFEPIVATRALLLSPLVWISLPTLSVLQKGNAQILAIVVSMLAMVLFERRRCAFGGALLAFMIVSKIFPGMLVIYLLMRRQWRAVAWTTGFAIAFSLVTLWTLGQPAYAAFLAHLPGLVGGEAFPAFRRPSAVAINYSIPGMIFKLRLFGVPGMGFTVAKAVGWIYTLVAIGATIAIGARRLSHSYKPLVWLAVLIVATLRSPFLPAAYAPLPAVWLLTLLAATRLFRWTSLATTLILWVILSFYWPMDWPIDPRLLALAITVPQGLLVVLTILTLREALESSTQDRSLRFGAAA
jgi:hypothetical protein